MSEVHLTIKGKRLTQSEFDEIEKYVLQYFHSLWMEIREAIYLLREKDSKFMKSELSLAFIGGDSLSRFNAIVSTGSEEKDSERRFRSWIDDFVLSEKNETYKKYKGEINCDSFTIWNLRNSLIHFYGLPKLKSEYVGFATLNQDSVKKFRKLVSEKHPGKTARVINPYRLIEAILEGLLTQAESIKETITSGSDADKETYIRGIVRCYEIIEDEGTVYITRKDF